MRKMTFVGETTRGGPSDDGELEITETRLTACELIRRQAPLVGG
ncbi:hypothetical protein [Streptomyces sp. NP-1717]|nr:hypothetical protein [Streptomyces sp. NP-1717]WTA71529.1 hypothetical protein OG705_00840 [Streptomyces sp. NBC_00838]